MSISAKMYKAAACSDNPDQSIFLSSSKAQGQPLPTGLSEEAPCITPPPQSSSHGFPLNVSPQGRPGFLFWNALLEQNSASG